MRPVEVVGAFVHSWEQQNLCMYGVKSYSNDQTFWYPMTWLLLHLVYLCELSKSWSRYVEMIYITRKKNAMFGAILDPQSYHAILSDKNISVYQLQGNITILLHSALMLASLDCELAPEYYPAKT
jgi:hypothetical protein